MSAECYKYLRLVDTDSFDRVFAGELGKVLCRMAVIQNEKGQDQETLQSYLEAAEAYITICENSNTHECDLADVYCNIAEWYEKHNHITEAISYYNRATEYMISSNSASLFL
jgi:tetratricopeptide (TPR) repeat protein